MAQAEDIVLAAGYILKHGTCLKHCKERNCRRAAAIRYVLLQVCLEFIERNRLVKIALDPEFDKPEISMNPLLTTWAWTGMV